MDGSFNGYLPYGQQQPPSHGGPSQPSPGSHTPHHQQSHPQHTALHPYGSLTGHPPNDSSAHPTLPPLQAQNGYSPYHSMPYGHPVSQSHTPPGSHTPVTASMGGPGGFAHQHPSMLPPSSFNSPYAMSQSMMYPSSTATAAMSQGAANTGLPNLRPMPPGGVTASMNGLPSLTTSGHMGQQSPFMKGEEAPTHVVGSQGRRGILPSAPGRPNAPSQGSGINAKSMIPQKDADGKFPCPHCNKTYLHAKHLKRHLLRHTGDRPYMCHLCKDTFSRSDILKRHFQKCSIRRGNPTGANHLAHQRRPTNSSNRLSVGQQDGPIGLAGMSDISGTPYQPVNVVHNSPSVNSELSARSSRANSLVGGGNLGHRNGVSGLGILGPGGPNGGESMTSSAAYQPGMAAYAMSTPPNGHMASNYAFNNPQMNGSGYNTPTHPMSFLGQTSSRFNNHPSSSPRPSYGNDEDSGNQVDWARMFSAGGQDGFVGSHPANASSHTNDIKTDHAESKPAIGTPALQSDPSHESFLGGLYSHPSAFGSEYSEYAHSLLGGDWNQSEGMKVKIESLKRYCSSSEEITRRAQVGAELMHACLTVDNVKHLLEHYFFCQQQWPILHMPTFDLMHADDGLVLAMLCTGAVYSPKLHATQVHHIIGFARQIILAKSSIHYRFMHQQLIGLGNQSHDIEELQALIMIQNLCIWNGDPPHREAARSEFPSLVRLVKAMGLLRTVTPDHYAYSVLHASTYAQSSPPANGSTFNWHGWVEQEKRNRVLYSVFLTDAALALFFNGMPQFNPLELRISLPADDAAWQAQDSHTCANALGLNGALAQQLDLTGNSRPQQPGMYEALRALLDPATVMPNRSTNVYSKFILIHALIVRIVICQKAMLLPEAASPVFNASLVGSAPATPMSQNDWTEQSGSGGNGPMTPTMMDAFESRAPMQIHQDKKRLGHALDKWKHSWDMDVESQFCARGNVPRSGFCRDGIQFFYLGRNLLQTQCATDWIATADVRFQQIMTVLKQVREFFTGDSRLQLQEIGLKGSVDGLNGIDSLTLDMSILFKPCQQIGGQVIPTGRA